jgi:hypothetical protein
MQSMLKHFLLTRRRIVDARPPKPQPRMRWHS